MLIDDLMPAYDFTEVHSIRIKATSEIVYQAILDTSLADLSGIVRFLFSLRALPEKMVGRQTGHMRQEQPLLSEMLKNNFIKLAEQPPREFVFGSLVPGQIGRVWQKSSGQAVTMADAREFMAFKDPGFLQVVANMRVEESGESGTVIVRTESRTRAFSPQSRKNFTPYWRLIRPFSGLIRRLWLRGIRRRAERELRSNSSFQVKGKIV